MSKRVSRSQKKEREIVKPVTRKRKQPTTATPITLPKKTMDTLQHNLITGVNDIKLLHVSAKSPVVFTIPASDNSDLYTLTLDFDMSDDNSQIEINYRCSCGDKYSKFGRNNCKHVGKVISAMMEKYIRNTIVKKELDVDIASLTIE